MRSIESNPVLLKFLTLVCKMISEIASLAVFRNKIDIAAILEGILELDDVGMLRHFLHHLVFKDDPINTFVFF